MMRSPAHAFPLAGVLFGVFVLVAGIFFLLASQGIIQFTLNLWSVCSVLIIMLGAAILIGSIWAHRRFRGRWRRWAEGFDKDF